MALDHLSYHDIEGTSHPYHKVLGEKQIIINKFRSNQTKISIAQFQDYFSNTFSPELLIGIRGTKLRSY